MLHRIRARQPNRSTAIVAGGVLVAICVLVLGAVVARAVTTADFTFSPSDPEPGEEITFSASSDAAQPIYRWDFENDGTFDLQGPQHDEVQHSYPDPGTYSVRLRVDDFDQTQSERVKDVTVTAPAPPPPPPGPPPPGPAPGPSPGTPPFVSVRVDEPIAGLPTRFDASGSFDGDGGGIVAFEWDFDDDGTFDASTGASPSSRHPFAEGSHSISVRAIDDEGASAITRVDFVAPERICETELRLANVELRTSCVTEVAAGRYELEGGAMVNGILLEPRDPEATLIVDTDRRTITSDDPYAAKLINTPLGDITLFRRALRGSDALRLPAVGASSAQDDPPEGAFRLVTFRAGDGCTPTLDTVCATLPGGLPIVGEIDVYVTSDFEAIIDIHAELPDPFTVRGDARLTASLSTGLRLNSLRIAIENADLGVFRLEHLRVAYEGPPEDAWEAEASVVLPTTPEAGVSGSVRFASGELESAFAELRGLPIPVGPGVTLNRLSGGFSRDPLVIRGGLGLALAAVAEVEGNFLFEDTTPSHFHVDGNFTLLEQELATASFDYWGNGDIEFAGTFGYAWPRGSDDPVVRLQGSVEGWWQDPRWQVDGRVDLEVWIIEAGVRVIVNNEWIAGCARIRVLFARVSAYAALRHSDGNLDVGFGCDLGDYEVERLRPRGRAAQAGESTFRVEDGLPAIGLQLFSATEAPIVALRSPSGEILEMPRDDREIVQNDSFTAVRTLDDHRLVVRLENPEGGLWTVIPADDSPPVSELRIAEAVGPARVRARVLGRGLTRRLVYDVRDIPGQRVRFLERSSTGRQLIGSTDQARGSIRFRPQSARGRRRSIIAVVEQDGRPRTQMRVARYTARGLVRPARPRRVRAVRRGQRVVVRWRSARRAKGYRVHVRSSDGRRNLLVTSRRRRRVVIRHVLRSERLVIRVRAEQGPGLAGRARAARLAPRARRSR